MVSLPASKTTHAARRAWPQSGVLFCVLTACALFLFIDHPPLPIQLWDESRVVVNALEMHDRGLSLITTYGWRPDLWNTKPPLLIWAMAASLSVFGVSEFALRLPTMAAALGILCLVFGFARKLSRSNWTASLATILLTLSPGFFGEHAARTADYDVPLSLFITGYACVLFFLLHRGRPSPFRISLAALLIAAATMTKGIAGLTPGAGVVVYLLFVGRWRKAWTRPYLAMGLGAAAPVAAFLIAREQASPGYLHATLFNDVAGRLSTSLDQHGGPPGAYLNICFTQGLFSCGWGAAAAAFALRIAKGRVRLGLMFSLCMAAGILGTDSLAATKLFQYAIPAYPFLAIACALAVQATLQEIGRLKYHFARNSALVCIASTLLIITGRGAKIRYIATPQDIYQPQAKYGELFTHLSRLGAKHIRAIDDGAWGQGMPNYMPQLRAEILIWRPMGLDVVRARDLRQALATPDSYTVTCDPRLIGALGRLGRDVGAISDCIALPPHP